MAQCVEYMTYEDEMLNPDNYEPRGGVVCERCDCKNYTDYNHVRRLGEYLLCEECHEELTGRDTKIGFVAATFGIRKEENSFLRFLSNYATDNAEKVDEILNAYIEESEYDFHRWAVTDRYKVREAC